jgi:hypothetical protein
MIGVATLGLFSLSVVFYIIAWVIQPGTEEIVRGRVEIVDSNRDENKFMDGEEYVDMHLNASQADRKIRVGERYHDREKLPDEFSKIEVGLRIIPS